MVTSRVFSVCLVIAAAATAQQQPYQAGGLIFWVPVLRQPATAIHSSPIAVAKAALPPTQVTSDSVSVPASPAASAPDVITHGLHLGNNVDPHASGYADDTPASVITHGPHPGAYTAVSSDEPAEATQFQSQDGQGQFVFGHSSPEQARLESRTADGTVRGSYSYVNPEGRTIKVSYTAGENGFQAVDDSVDGTGVFPRPVTDTPEVQAARALHARLYDRARWLAESSPEHEEVKPGVVNAPVAPTPAPPVQVPSSDEQSNGAVADQYHPPDNLYANMGSVSVESDEDLTYYGAAKGKPMPYAGPQQLSKSAHHDYYGPGNALAKPLAYSGAYYFPGNQYYYPQISHAPILSPYSVPSLYEQQNQHRVSPGLHNEPQQQSAEVLQARTAPKPDAYKTPDYLEYYGAAKLLAYSAVNHLFDNNQSHRGGKSLSAPEIPTARKTPDTPEQPIIRDSPSSSEAPVSAELPASNDEPSEQVVPDSPAAPEQAAETPAVQPPAQHQPRYSSYQQSAPVYLAVGVAPPTEPQDLPSLRTAIDTPSSHPAIVPPASVSQKAAYFNAVPVAAVHDAQVAPGQSVKDHQTLPVYIEAN